MREAAAAGAANTVLLKPNQRGTLTETRAAWDAAREPATPASSRRARARPRTRRSCTSRSAGAPQLKVGSFARGERMAKWNEALRIEERLGARARFAGTAAFGRRR